MFKNNTLSPWNISFDFVRRRSFSPLHVQACIHTLSYLVPSVCRCFTYRLQLCSVLVKTIHKRSITFLRHHILVSTTLRTSDERNRNKSVYPLWTAIFILLSAQSQPWYSVGSGRPGYRELSVHLSLIPSEIYWTKFTSVTCRKIFNPTKYQISIVSRFVCNFHVFLNPL